jgi:4-nitrophenyl phosphatase
MDNDFLRNAECFLFDMDGTIYLDDQLLPGAEGLIDFLTEEEIPHFFVTNNSSRSQEDYVTKLAGLGLDVPREKIFTSGEATARYLEKQKPNATIYLVGTPSLEEEFQKHGFILSKKDPDFAVLGFDTTLTYEKLWDLCDFVRAGIPYIATHPDVNCPTVDGFMPDIGSMIALVAASTGRHPDVIVGKPNAPIVEAIVDKTGFDAHKIVMVGDRLYTDIALGQAGLTTVLVLSGETQHNDISEAEFQPDFVLENVAELLSILRKPLTQ